MYYMCIYIYIYIYVDRDLEVRGPAVIRFTSFKTEEEFRGNHLSNTTSLIHVLFKSGE